MAMRRASAVCAHVRGVPSARWAQLRPLCAAQEPPPTRFGPVTNGVAEITLCRPKKLNSLSWQMITDLTDTYNRLASEGVRCVVLRGEGRALCAGGDVAEIREGVLNGTSLPKEFFYHEYQLDYSIATLYEREHIVQVSLWDGIVMGGGVGLSLHSPIRVATEKTMFAMPETNIGLFPDVGATHALSRLKAGKHVGLYLGSSAARIGAADCLEAGLATHYCPSDRLGDLLSKLQSLGAEANSLEAVSNVINAVAAGASPSTEKAFLAKEAAAIERCYRGSPSAEEILARLEAEEGDWAAKTLETFRGKSPTSVKVFLEAVERHQTVTLREAFVTEYRISQWCMRPQPHSDFCEGIRAVLVDKDNKFSWQPPRIEEVTQERVNGFFAPLPSDHIMGELNV